MLKIALLVIALLLSTPVIAQKKQNVYFLKYNGKYVKLRDSADFVRVVQEPDSGSVLYNVYEFYKTGEKKLIGKSSKIDPPVFEGNCVKFYKNGHKKSLEIYYHGEQTGPEYDFHANGKLFMARQFPDTGDSKRYASLTYNYLIMEVRDSSGNVLINNGNGYYKGYYPDFGSVEEQGQVKEGKMEGEWKGFDKTMKINFIESYEGGILTKGTATDSLGISQTYTKLREKTPEFNGGIKAFYKYLSETIEYPMDARENNIQGTVMLGFVVEKDGSVSDVKIDKSVSRNIDKEAVRVLTKSPHWIPASQYGRNVQCAYTVPISFALSD
jgi:TonB family protein